jgi:hypothetical protein
MGLYHSSTPTTHAATDDIVFSAKSRSMGQLYGATGLKKAKENG